jgi:4-hydroxybenzoate polyprenyltransferase
MWATYAHPRIRWKSVSALPTAIHVTGGVLTALLVQGAFAPLDARGAAVGLYFGLVLAAGHLTHEVLDRDADAKAGFATSAIRFGPRRVLAASFATMTASTAWFALLTARGVVPAVALAGPLLIFVPYLAEFVRARRAPASHEAVLRFRARYRVLYAVSSMWIAAAVILSRH